MADLSTFDLIAALGSLGDLVKLNDRCDPRALRAELEPFAADWKFYNPDKPNNNRHGLSVTSLDGGLSGYPDLYSLADLRRRGEVDVGEMDITTPTPVWSACRSLTPILSKYQPWLGRTHFLRLDAGGFFPPHRDSFGLAPRTFRLIMPCFGVEHGDYVFMMDDERVHMEAGNLYFMNTRRAHSVFSFVDGSTMLVMNVALVEDAVQKVAESATYR